MNIFHRFVTSLAGLLWDVVWRQTSSEIRLGTVVAREEFFAQAELQAAEFERTNRPELAAAVRAEIARLRKEDATQSERASDRLNSALSAPQPLPVSPPAEVPVKRLAKKAPPQSPPASDPFAPPPGPPWIR